MLTVIDLGVGNLGSLTSALRFLGADYLVSESAADVTRSSAVVLPGVGAFDAAVNRMDQLDLREPLLERVNLGIPILGVCLGMQILLDRSEEGRCAGLGLVTGESQRLGIEESTKVPHVGFDAVSFQEGSWAAEEVGATNHYYFTHSFAVRSVSSDVAVGHCDYDGGFVAALERWPVVGVQFHPEKSQSAGLRFLLAFLTRWRDER